jgi:GT2 family glycosyltransferase
MDKVAIVILNWNGAEMLRKYLPSVIDYSRDDATIYVADNASTDDSLKVLQEEFNECKLILLDKNWGFADGYNKSLEQIDAEYYFLLNSDVRVTHHWLTPLIEFMDNHSEVAACQPKILSEWDNDYFEYAGACGGFIDKYGYPFCRGRIFDVVEEDNAQYDYNQSIFWATGAAMMIRSVDYKNVGGLDGRFFAHNEEIDLCWRLRSAGRKIYCIPESIVYHVGGGTLPKSNSRKTFLNFRNNLLMLYKNVDEKELRHVMFIRYILDYVAAYWALIHGNLGDFKAIYRARREFLHLMPSFQSSRLEIQRNVKLSDIPERCRFSILYQYYVKGCKLFSSLPI